MNKGSFAAGIFVGMVGLLWWAFMMNAQAEYTCRQLTGAKECKLLMTPIKESNK